MSFRFSLYGAILATALAAASSSVVWAAQGAPSVEFTGGKLSVDVERTPLEQVVSAIEAKAHVKIRIPDAARKLPVTAKFRDLALEQGMKEILRNLSLESHAVLYEKPGGRAIAFVVLESAKGGVGEAPDALPTDDRYPQVDPLGVRVAPTAVPPKPAREVPTMRAPVYIAPAREPEYAPPRSEPKEVPP